MRSLRYGDIALVVLVIAIAAMLIIPLPTALLDVLLVVNISFSVLLLLVGLYLPNNLALLAFPTILLLSTLFRLGLNVASSRLILSQGYAGQVIDAFGSFLISGEVIVGVIIFTIVTIVNFIVIARGASRVSEVAARFALDALPGRQLAIDSDMRAGLISAEEARRRRDELRRESQLFGSMDGAMKFVQGDAIAGLFVIAANILGGMYLGVREGQELGEAVQTYTVMTVGDGLVSQIPALLTSICAGIVVTRVSSSEGSTLSADLGAQLFNKPATLITTGVIVFALALLPGLPSLPFAIVGIMAIGGGWLIRREQRQEGDPQLPRLEYRGAGASLSGKTRDEDTFEENTLVLNLDASLLRSYRAQAPRYRGWWKECRDDFYRDIGLRLPEIGVTADDYASSLAYRVSMNGTELFCGVALPDALLVEMNPSSAEVFGLQVIAEVEHPLTGHRVFWAAHTPVLKRTLDAGAIRSFDFFEYIGLETVRYALHHPEEFLSATSVFASLKTLEQKYPGILEEGFGREVLSVPRLTDVLCELVRHGINIRDFRSIVESLASYCAAQGTKLEGDGAADVYEIVPWIRSAKRRQLRQSLGLSDTVVQVIKLSDEVEQIFDEAENQSGSAALAVPGEILEGLSLGLLEVVKAVREQGVIIPVVLCGADTLPKVQTFLHHAVPTVAVITAQELEPRTRVEPLGTWSIHP